MGSISGGFASLPEAIDESIALNPVMPEDVRSADEQWDDETALGIVLGDTMDTMAYLSSKNLMPFTVDNADNLVRGYSQPRQWPDGKPRASLTMHTTLQAIEKILPALYLSLFGQGKKTPFLVTPIGKTSPEAARANSSLLAWAMKGNNTKEEMRIMLKTALTYGFAVGTWGWECKTQRKKKYKQNPTSKTGKMVGEWVEEDIEVPTFEALELKQVLVDPGLKRQDIQAGAKFVIKQLFTNGYGLADFRNNPAFKNIPSQEQMADFLGNNSEPTTDTLATNKATTWRQFQAQLPVDESYTDPMLQPLELLEYTTKDRVITILQRKLVIRNEANEFGKINFQSCAFIDVLGSAWGFGIAQLLAGEQRLQTGVMNNTIDSMALVMNPVFQMLKGLGPGTQSIPISPGKVITETGELKPLIVPDVSKSGLAFIAESDQRANDKVGANGGSNLTNAAMRTAEGVSAVAGEAVQRLQYFLEQFINLVYLPTLEAFLMVMKEHLTVDQVNTILTTEQGKAYEGDISDVYNAEVDVDVIAGANMLAHIAMAQIAPLVMQLVSAGPVADQFEIAGKKFNYTEFVTEVLDISGWDVGNLIQDMTPEDLARVQQKNAALTKAQADLALQQAKHQDNLSEIDAKGSAQAGVAVVRQTVKSHLDAGQAAQDAITQEAA